VPYVYRGFDLVKDYAKEVLPDSEEDDEEETQEHDLIHV
jgi:hypothetical protein